jgi:hypothetical protein
MRLIIANIGFPVLDCFCRSAAAQPERLTARVP